MVSRPDEHEQKLRMNTTPVHLSHRVQELRKTMKEAVPAQQKLLREMKDMNANLKAFIKGCASQTQVILAILRAINDTLQQKTRAFQGLLRPLITSRICVTNGKTTHPSSSNIHLHPASTHTASKETNTPGL